MKGPKEMFAANAAHGGPQQTADEVAGEGRTGFQHRRAAAPFPSGKQQNLGSARRRQGQTFRTALKARVADRLAELEDRSATAAATAARKTMERWKGVAKAGV